MNRFTINVAKEITGSSIFSVTTSNKCIWEMIRTVGVIQLKYYYKMNINSIQIQFIEYAFHLNWQNCGETPCQSQIPPLLP